MSAALDYYAAHGAALFPLPYGSKASGSAAFFPSPDDPTRAASWKHCYSRDPSQWAKWLVQHPGCNFAVVAFAGRWIIIDIDTKPDPEACKLDPEKAKADAQNEAWQGWVDLCKAWGFEEAFAPQVQSARGGWHVYFQIPDHIDPETLRQPDAIKGRVNVRCIGYTVAAGGYYDGTAKGEESGHYAMFDNPAAPYPAPEPLLEHCAPPKPRETVAKVGTHDFADAMKLYQWMASNGAIASDEEWRTVGMAAKLEFGDAGLQLWETIAQTLWNEAVDSRNLARWQSFGTEPALTGVTMKSVFALAHNAGWKGTVRQSAASMFSGVAQYLNSPPIAAAAPTELLPAGVPMPQTEDEYTAPPGGLIKRVSEVLKHFELPEYIWDGILQRGFCYSITAQTGTGKTALAMLFAAHVDSGIPLAGSDVERGQVLYLAGENPVDVQMRWLGLTQDMAIDPDDFGAHTIEGVIPLSKAADVIRAECAQKGLQPSLIVVDTAAAYFEGDQENDNSQLGNYARQLRELCKLPGRPCVLVLCHPTKGAKDIGEMVPRGGGAFLNEVDGNLGMARVDGGPIAVQVVGKFRGPEFAPLRFALHTISDHPRLVDRKGKQHPTVICRPVTEAGAAAWTAENQSSDVRLIQDIDTHPGDSMRERGVRLGCNASTVKRRIDGLAARRLLDNTGLIVRLTAKGQKELNALESAKQVATGVALLPAPRTG